MNPENGFWTAIAMAISAVVASWITARFQSRPAQRSADANVRSADANVQQAINDGFADLTGELRKELAASKTERADLRKELSASRAEREKMGKQITTLRGAIRGLVQHVNSLENLLRNHGIDIPERPHRATPGLEALLVMSTVEGENDFGGQLE